MSQTDPSVATATIRALAGAVNALRLYPPTSDLPSAAIAKFVELANDATQQFGHLRYVIEPKSFTWGDTKIGRDNAQIEVLAALLYSHQAGQLLIARDVTTDETVAFVQAFERETADVTDAGGITKVLVDAGISHLAVVEMSVRTSREEGLKGVDLLAAPLDEIGAEITAAADRWAQAGTEDEAAAALESLPDATKSIAADRITQALLQLDEATRTRVLSSARKQSPGGKPMQGMLGIVGRMSPSALARLLKLVAGQTGEDPLSILPELDLPPEAMDLLQTMLSPSPQSEQERGVPPEANVGAMEQIMTAEKTADEEASIESLVASSHPAKAAGRGLSTACTVATMRPDADSVRAVGEALPPALRAGSFPQVDQALSLLEEQAQDPQLTDEVARARRGLADPELLADACAVVDKDVAPESIARLITAAGDVGYDVFVGCWVGADATKREHFRPVLARLGDRLVVAVGKLVRSGGGPRAREAVALLGHMGDSRAIPVLTQFISHDDRSIRLAALAALADIGGAEVARHLGEALGSPDAETRSAAAREIARGEVREAIPDLIGAVEKYHLFERDAGFKTEVIDSIVAVGATDAVPALKRVVSRGFAFGAGNKVVRARAREAIAQLGPA